MSLRLPDHIVRLRLPHRRVLGSALGGMVNSLPAPVTDARIRRPLGAVKTRCMPLKYKFHYNHRDG